jgi:uncharacterized protein YecE (DUF72 family)
LRPYARDLKAWAADGNDAYVYFNNDIGGHAIMDALDLLDLMGDARHEKALPQVAPELALEHARA